jgi:uncharacterized membrane protein HdeD (DUF308 family)
MADQVAADVVALRRFSWVPVVRGVILLVLGVLMLSHPVETATALAWVFGVFAVIDGVMSLVQWWTNRRVEGSLWWLVIAAMELAVGVVVIVWPSQTVRVVFYLVAIWMLLLGIFGIIGSATLYRVRDLGWYWSLAFGLIAFLFGLLLLLNPQTSVKVVVVVLGLFAFAAGALLVVGGFAIRALASHLAPRSAEPVPPRTVEPGGPEA